MIRESELILNPDGSIYHLGLLPQDLAETVITVGDPDRVDQVSRHFDRIELKKENREFRTHTGVYKGKRISVISTGIGPDNIDIVINELDALVNIDFQKRVEKEKPMSLDLIRIGTCGGLQPELELDSLAYSSAALGFDNLLHYYRDKTEVMLAELLKDFEQQTAWGQSGIPLPYAVGSNIELATQLGLSSIQAGITATNVGFYAPQGRSLRLRPTDDRYLDRLKGFSFNGQKILNLEMETAAIYAMAGLLGHRAVSISVVLANRSSGAFSKDAPAAIDKMIRFTLDRLSNIEN
ncbi:nucleoside phosphorylase [Aureitalea marina]|uniref:Uridine phosphorylase n=1 Tax=Aureitalea marina TaxID=930804 RepID=A0A2S7KTL0_9FLAO|nr:nucleoside phosphorylase [Aureitalea marina]PQB05969.1 phosphorylase [Aureitalea marina]